MKILAGAAMLGLVAIPTAPSRNEVLFRTTPASFDVERRVAPSDANQTLGPMDKKKTALRRLAQAEHLERPFGGPMPPKRRSLEPPRSGTGCKTPTTVCKLQKKQPVGDACSCPETDGKPTTGIVVDQSG
jgi:hypothetical protein